MISVTERVRDVLRFLWVDDVNQEPPIFRVLRIGRVVFGVSSSPFLLNATIKHHLDQFSLTYPDLIRTLSQSLYVDDVISGADSESQAYELCIQAKDVLGREGFNLQKFISNSNNLQKRVNEGDQESSTEGMEETYTKSNLGSSLTLQSGEQKVLGVRWDVSIDHLMFNLDDIAISAKILEPTERHVVHVVGRFYDPIGFLAPITIQFKVFFLELCKAKIGWDDCFTGD